MRAVAIQHLKDARRSATATNAREIRQAVRTFYVAHEQDGCPTVEQLVADGILDRGSPRHDAWGQPWQIECLSGDDANVISAGEDRKMGTPDDIRAPPT